MQVCFLKGQKLEEWIAENNLTYTSFSKKIGVSVRTLFYYRNNTYGVSPPVRQKILELTKLSFDSLFEKKER